MFPGAAEADARGMPRHILSTIRRAADRGTTVVEYTLIGGLIALASVSAMQYMNDVANQGMETTLADLETGAPVENAGGGGGGGGATTTTAGGGGGGGTPTTVAPTTSTTAAPTTSTTARSTTPPAWSDTSSQWESWRQNEWEASTRVTVYDNAGLPLPSGSEVRVRITIGNSSYTEWIDVSNGRVRVSVDDIDENRSSIRIEVIDVRNDNGWWNGQTSTITIDRPRR